MKTCDFILPIVSEVHMEIVNINYIYFTILLLHVPSKFYVTLIQFLSDAHFSNTLTLEVQYYFIGTTVRNGSLVEIGLAI